MMNTNAAPMEGPSKGRLLQATAIAVAVALALLFTIILPAEYGIDPTGIGARLGLTGLAAAGVESAATAGDAAAGPVIEAPTIKGTFIAQPKRYKIDSREIKLGLGEGVEIKYHMEKGAGMVYSWMVTPPNEVVFYEFHAEPDEKPVGAGDDYYESYELDNKVGKSQSHGTFIAPNTGIHGWFWENATGVPVTVTLVTAGFYDYIVDYTSGIALPVQPADPK
jgi:hypothetical protein